MTISLQEVEHIALLARINITEEEKNEFAGQLNTVLQYAEKLNEINTKGIDPLYHILPIFNVFREDEIIESPDRNELFANAPDFQNGYFKVPKIL